MASLKTVRLKLLRAEEHFKTVVELIGRFSMGQCEIVPEEDKESNIGVLRVRLPEPPDQLSVIIGDFLYALRSALDHLVWQLVLTKGAAMKSLRILGLLLFLAASAAALESGGGGSGPIYCDCDSWLYVDPATGYYESDAWSFVDDPYGDCWDYCSAMVTVSMHDSLGTTAAFDSEVDNLDFGDAESVIPGQYGVYLNDTYTENARHRVYAFTFDGFDYSDSATSWFSYVVPDAPTISAVAVVVPSPADGTFLINYNASPPVLYQATVTVFGQAWTNLNGSGGSFLFHQDQLPNGASTFQFYGYMYGWIVTPPGVEWVTRQPAQQIPGYVTRTPGCDEHAGDLQPFTVQAFERADFFTYSVPLDYSTSATTLALGGLLNIYTSASADCGFVIGLLPNLPAPSGYNTAQDVIGNSAFGWMSQPTTQTAQYAQSPTFQTLANDWAAFFVPGTQGQECTTYWIDGVDTGIAAPTVCANVALSTNTALP